MRNLSTIPMRAEIRIKANEGSSLIAEALKPESEVTDRTTVQVIADNDELVIRVQADDVSSLRAALNSYLRMARLAIDSQRALGDE